jgi:hypothetical protein
MNNRNRITEWIPERGVDRTQYGRVTNIEWAAHECERIKRSGGPAKQPIIVPKTIGGRRHIAITAVIPNVYRHE